MFDNANHYTLRTEVAEGITRCYVSFVDGEAIHHEIEVSRSIYLEFLRFVKVERNLRRWDERHTEQSDLTDETLHSRALNPQKSVEDAVIDGLCNEQLQRAVESLPEIQRRRFVLYHEYGLTYEQIADMEGCTFQAVGKAVKAAETAIKNIFEKQG
jgi:RNA polymerase sigma-70 factor (ECF subfamily)